jgi:hypothetical protein
MPYGYPSQPEVEGRKSLMIRTMNRTATMPVVTCAGAPRERGEAHGETLRELIASGLAWWAESIAAAHRVEPDDYIARFIQHTDYLPAIRRWTPGLLEEAEGIARGAGQPWEWIYAYNLLDEEWTWARAFRNGSGPGCTAAGVIREGSAPLLAQTMDIPNVHDGTQAMLRLETEDAPAALVFTHAGLIGLTGCNTEGLALVVNNLETLPTSATGLPVAFVIRGILERRTLADAVAFAREVPHATGQHYGMAAPSGLASVEGWATGTAIDGATDTSLMHTNHPLLAEVAEGDVEAIYRRSRTRERLSYLRREGAAESVAGMQALLSDRTVPVSRAANRPSMTFGAVVYECEQPARMWVAPGPPHETPFVEIGWLARTDVPEPRRCRVKQQGGGLGAGLLTLARRRA